MIDSILAMPKPKNKLEVKSNQEENNNEQEEYQDYEE